MAPPTGFTQTYPAQITTAGESSGLLIQLPNNSPNPPAIAKVGVYGTYASGTLVVRGHVAGSSSTTFYPIGGINVENFNPIESGGTISLTDNSSNLFKFPIAGYDQLEIYASNLGSGTINVEVSTSTAELVTPPIVNATSSTSSLSGPLTVTTANANAAAVGPNGTTNPTFNVDTSTASAATGLNVKAAAAGGGLAESVISSGTNENLTIDAKGSGTITLNSIGTGSVVIGSSLTVSAVNIITDTTTGTKIGTATTQKLGFFNATPVVQPANTVDYVTMFTSLGLRATGGAAAATFPGAVLSSGTGGVGYTTGAGGAVTQITSRTTGVTINTPTGAITLVSAAGSATPFSFTVTNSSVGANDIVQLIQKSGTDGYSTDVTAVAAGSFKLTISDLTGTTTEAPVFQFLVFKGAIS